MPSGNFHADAAVDDNDGNADAAVDDVDDDEGTSGVDAAVAAAIDDDNASVAGVLLELSLILFDVKTSFN